MLSFRIICMLVGRTSSSKRQAGRQTARPTGSDRTGRDRTGRQRILEMPPKKGAKKIYEKERKKRAAKHKSYYKTLHA